MKYDIATVINIDQCGIMLNEYISLHIVVGYFKVYFIWTSGIQFLTLKSMTAH